MRRRRAAALVRARSAPPPRRRRRDPLPRTTTPRRDAAASSPAARRRTRRNRSAAEARKIVAALDAGATNINDVLGRLYNKASSPDVKIPRGGAAPAVTAPEYAMAPADCEHVVSAIAHVGPKSHFPDLRAKYDLVRRRRGNQTASRCISFVRIVEPACS